MKKIFYYITDHGKGHATRSIAIIKELQKNFDVFIRNSIAQDMIQSARACGADTVKFKYWNPDYL